MRRHKRLQGVEEELRNPLMRNGGHGQKLDESMRELHQMVGVEGQVIRLAPIPLSGKSWATSQVGSPGMMPSGTCNLSDAWLIAVDPRSFPMESVSPVYPIRRVRGETDFPARSDRPLFFGNHGIAERAQVIDLDLDDIARLEPDRRLARHADARGRAGEDQVARLQGENSREISDQLVDLEDELAGARVLHGLAIQPQADAEVVGVGNLVGRDQLGTDRREGVERLAGHPLLARLVELPVAAETSWPTA